MLQVLQPSSKNKVDGRLLLVWSDGSVSWAIRFAETNLLPKFSILADIGCDSMSCITT